MSTDSAVLSQARYLKEIQNDDGGWGIEAGYPSSPTNTAEVVTSLHMADVHVALEVEKKATEFLERNQCYEGGWGSRSRGEKASTGRTVPTAWAIRALSKCAHSEKVVASLDAAWTYLLAQQQSSGAWIECSNTLESVTATCHALCALLTSCGSAARPQRKEAIDRGLTWLAEVQREGRIGFTAEDKPRLPTTVYVAFIASTAEKEGFAHDLSSVIRNVRRAAQQARPSLFQTEVERADLGTFPSQHEHFTVPVLVAALLAIDEPTPVLWPFMRQLWKVQTLGRGVSCELGGRYTTWATAQWLLAMSELKRAATEKPSLFPAYQSMSNDERALVLKGGGVKGLALAGAVATLEEKGQRFDLFAGTSAGAIGALLLAAGYTGKELMEKLRELDMREFLDSPLRMLKNLVTRGALHSGDPIRRWIRTQVEEKLDRTHPVRMRHLGRRALVFAANDDGTVAFDSHGKYRDVPVDFAARCSMSIPFFFSDPRHEGEAIYDGGLLNNFPVQELVREKGDSNFVGLYLKRAELTGVGHALKVFRIVRILLNRDEQRTVEQYRDQTVVIDPAPIKTTQFSLSDTEKEYLIAQGRAAALELLARNERAFQTEVVSARERVEELRTQVLAAAKSRRVRRLIVGVVLAAVAAAVWFFIES